MAKVEPVATPAEAAVQTPVQTEKIIGIPPMNIPVEEPARPVIRPSAPADIFATPRTGIVEPAVSAPFEAPLVAEPVAPPPPVIAATPSQISPPEEPVQIAKVVPAAPEAVEKMTEDILKALGDVYFDYDRFSIRKDAIPVLQENAQALVAALSNKNIVIEGHCDERGTESYNMVLGERRANAVKEFLVDLGVPGDKLEVMSYGKEKPFCSDQNEQCWQENRRGHFVLR
jgi:peptidoglycan-associated lipoprotein